jgi:hypothetical protein
MSSPAATGTSITTVEGGGYPDAIFTTITSEALKCPICFKVMNDPVRACVDGDHCYCRTCLTAHLRNQRQCPECRVAVPTDKSLRSARVLNTLILELPVQCYMNANSKINLQSSNVTKSSDAASKTASTAVSPSVSTEDAPANACFWTGKLVDLRAHAAVCGSVKVACSTKDCGVVMPRRKLAAHEAVCPHQLVKCPSCSATMKFLALRSHTTAACHEIKPPPTQPLSRTREPDFITSVTSQLRGLTVSTPVPPIRNRAVDSTPAEDVFIDAINNNSSAPSPPLHQSYSSGGHASCDWDVMSSSSSTSSSSTHGGRYAGVHHSTGSANGSALYTGSRGGTFYVNGNGNKTYVSSGRRK